MFMAGRYYMIVSKIGVCLEGDGFNHVPEATDIANHHSSTDADWADQKERLSGLMVVDVIHIQKIVVSELFPFMYILERPCIQLRPFSDDDWLAFSPVYVCCTT
jgi:hypothetical protein